MNPTIKTFESTLINAVIVNIDPYDILSKLKTTGGVEQSSIIDSVQRLDVKNGYHFLQPIYISSKFHSLFERLSHLTSGGVPLEKQEIYLLLKRQNNRNSILMIDKKIKIVEQSMTLDQLISMSKVLRAGGMTVLKSFKKSTTSYYLPSLNIHCIVYTLSHMPAFLEVKAQSEEELLEGLAIFGIAMNRAELGATFNEVVKNYSLRAATDLIKFLV